MKQIETILSELKNKALANHDLIEYEKLIELHTLILKEMHEQGKKASEKAFQIATRTINKTFAK